jgi:hypothetical protein
MIKLELTVDEVNAILQVLGDLPTKTGAFPLVMKIKEQAEPQVPKEETPAETPAPEAAAPETPVEETPPA